MHHIQKTIISRLARVTETSFSDLQPSELENKLFNYHLKRTIAEGLVRKTDKGYSLTPTGRKMWKRISDKTEHISERAFSVLFLIVKNFDGEWLLYKRKTHPLLGRVGFMHCTPNAHEPIVSTARKSCHEKTGLTADFRVIGSGYFHIFSGDILESFTHFTLLSADNVTGNLSTLDGDAEYFWASDPDFQASDMLPNMKILADAYRSSNDSLVYLDETIQI